MWGKEHSKTTKDKISAKHLNKHISKEHRKNISNTSKSKEIHVGKDNPMYGKTGKDCPNWKGGSSKEPYCFEFTDDLKDYIKERDGYTCQNPFCKGNCGILCVHHIDYNKKNCFKENLLTIGNSCNSQANFNRKWWKAVYKEV
ncbi:unnamed protein product, partial [marine sediment metagenome]